MSDLPTEQQRPRPADSLLSSTPSEDVGAEVRPSRLQTILRWVRWPLALGVLGLLIATNINGVRELMHAGVNWGWVGLAAAVRMTAIGLASVRWNLLLRGQQIQLPFRRVFRLFTTGYVCNFLLPGTVGGDVARAGLIAADSPQRRMRGAATVPLDRLLGLLGFIVVGAVAGAAQWNTIPTGILQTSVVILIGFASAGLLGLLTLLIVPFPLRRRDPGSAADPDTADEGAALTAESPSPKPDPPAVQGAGHELLFGIALLRESRRSVLIAFVMAMIGHSCLSVSFFSCLQAFPGANVPANLTRHLWIVPSAEVPAALLPLPGGVGAREGALSLLYGALGSRTEDADHYREVGVVVAATFSTVSVILAVLIAAWLALSGGFPSGPPPDPQAGLSNRPE